MFNQVSEDLFTLEDELRFQFGLTLVTRMTVLRRGTDLWVHSPLPAGPWYDAIEELGTVRFLVAPSTYHCSYIEAAKERFPSAVLVAPEELEEAKPLLDVDMRLGDAVSDVSWPKGLQCIPVLGAPKIAEHLFYDAASRSLLITDLLFHNDRGTNLATRILLGIFAPTGSPCRSREWPWMLIKDRDAFIQSLDVLDTLVIDRIIGAHGHILIDIPLALSLMRTGKAPAAEAKMLTS